MYGNKHRLGALGNHFGNGLHQRSGMLREVNTSVCFLAPVEYSYAFPEEFVACLRCIQLENARLTKHCQHHDLRT